MSDNTGMRMNATMGGLLCLNVNLEHLPETWNVIGSLKKKCPDIVQIMCCRRMVTLTELVNCAIKNMIPDDNTHC